MTLLRGHFIHIYHFRKALDPTYGTWYVYYVTILQYSSLKKEINKFMKGLLMLQRILFIPKNDIVYKISASQDLKKRNELKKWLKYNLGCIFFYPYFCSSLAPNLGIFWPRHDQRLWREWASWERDERSVSWMTHSRLNFVCGQYNLCTMYYSILSRN